jgi:hypothetical protein
MMNKQLDLHSAIAARPNKASLGSLANLLFAKSSKIKAFKQFIFSEKAG